ncbi:MAG: hypothetical protein ABIH91_01780, partial [Candidatus Omnitrophota bacterium]
MRRRSEKGFVLPEVMLAAAIAAFAVCGILLMYVTAMDLIRTSKNASIATSAAQGLIEEIRNTPFPEIVTNYNLLKFSVDGIPPINGVASSSGIVYVDDTDPEFLLVTISVCWRQGNRIIGEDINLNGELDVGEDTSGNGIIDSTVELKLVSQFYNYLQKVPELRVLYTRGSWDQGTTIAV